MPVTDSDAELDILTSLAQAVAENTRMKSNVRKMEHTLATERATLKQMLDVDPSLPVSLLVSLLTLGRQRNEDQHRLEAAELVRDSILERFQSITARESMLVEGAGCTSTSDGIHAQQRRSTVPANLRRVKSLRRERAQADADMKLRVQQISVLKERLAQISAVERHSWGALQGRKQGNALVRRCPKDGTAKNAMPNASTSTSTSIPPTVIVHVHRSSESPERKPVDIAMLPEIPNSPSVEDLVDARAVTSGDSAQSPPTGLSVASATPLHKPSTLRPTSFTSSSNSAARTSTSGSMLTSASTSAADTLQGLVTPTSPSTELPDIYEQQHPYAREAAMVSAMHHHTHTSPRRKQYEPEAHPMSSNDTIKGGDAISPSRIDFDMAPPTITVPCGPANRTAVVSIQDSEIEQRISSAQTSPTTRRPPRDGALKKFARGVLHTAGWSSDGTGNTGRTRRLGSLQEESSGAESYSTPSSMPPRRRKLMKSAKSEDSSSAPRRSLQAIKRTTSWLDLR